VPGGHFHVPPGTAENTDGFEDPTGSIPGGFLRQVLPAQH
jgi:hypothetical protein